MSQQQSVSEVYLPGQFGVLPALRQKLQIKFSVSSSQFADSGPSINQEDMTSVVG